jgi:hypothetical protein
MAVATVPTFGGADSAYPSDTDKFHFKWTTLEVGETISTFEVVFLDNSADYGAEVVSTTIDEEYTIPLITVTNTTGVMECLYKITTSENRNLSCPVNIVVAKEFYGK